MELALALGEEDVDALGERMSSKQFSEWLAFRELHGPFAPAMWMDTVAARLALMWAKEGTTLDQVRLYKYPEYEGRRSEDATDDDEVAIIEDDRRAALKRKEIECKLRSLMGAPNKKCTTSFEAQSCEPAE